MPLKFWGYTVQTATHIINRLPSKLHDNKTPYEALFCKKQNFLNLKAFGSLCFACTITQGNKKFDKRAKKCIFIGYPLSVKGFLLYDLQLHQVFTSRNAIFYESIFRFTIEDVFVQTEPAIVFPSLASNIVFHDVFHSPCVSSGLIK